jgi:hypothetical protein
MWRLALTNRQMPLVSQEELQMSWVPALKGLTPFSLLSSSYRFHRPHPTAV